LSQQSIVLTLHIQIGPAGQVVALPDYAGVLPGVGHLGVLDDEGEHIFVDNERVLVSFVAFLEKVKGC
jgi:hypothetical protein